MNKNDSICKHRPAYHLQWIYGGKTYLCKKCGKRIKADNSHEILAASIFIPLIIIIMNFAAGINDLIKPNIVLLIIVTGMVVVIIWWLLGSFIYLKLLPFHVVDDELVSEQENEKKH